MRGAVKNIQDSIVLVTGANRGIGLAFVHELIARGAKKIYAAARDIGSIHVPGVIPVLTKYWLMPSLNK